MQQKLGQTQRTTNNKMSATKQQQRQQQLDELTCNHSKTTSSSIIGMKANRKSNATQSDTRRPHFRIDWRQLTYYHNEGRSLLADLWPCKWQVGAGKRAASSCSEDTNSSSSSSSGSHAPAGRKRILNSLDGCFRLSAVLSSDSSARR